MPLPPSIPERFPLPEPGTLAVERGDFLGDPTKPIKLLYGRKWTQGDLIELTAVEQSQGKFQHAAFYSLCEGEISSIEDFRVDGQAESDLISAESTFSFKDFGLYFRSGAVGVDDTETEAEYQTDATTQLRSQNFDYRTGTATAYSETAYAIFVHTLGTPIATAPRFEADIKGIKVESYSSTGSASGSPGFDDNSVWILVDYFTSDKHGLGLSTADIDFGVTQPTADTDVAGTINSTEANTTISTSQPTPSTTMIVNSTEGFVRGRTILVNASITNSVVTVDSDTQMTLGTSMTQTSGNTVQQQPPRFSANILVDRFTRSQQFISDILLTFRGYVTYDDGKIQIRSEKATVAEILTDGGVENWASATDLSDWDETTAGGSVNQDTDSNAGTYAARLDKTTSATSNLMISDNSVAMDSGRYYKVEFYAKTDTTQTSAASVRIQNSTAAEWLQTDGSWGVSAAHLINADLNLTYTKHSLVFRTKQSYGDSDTYSVQVAASQADSGSSVYFDSISLRGPYSGHFKEISPNPGFGILDESFEWEAPDVSRQINRVQMRLDNDGSNIGRDEIVVQDFTHQLTHKVKTLRLRGNAFNDRDHAHRICQWALDKAQTLGPGCSFGAGPGALALQPGDIVLVDHTVPNWTEKELRVSRKEILGLGDPDEFFVNLDCEDYNEAIYLDSSIKPRSTPARGAGVLTTTIHRATSRGIDIEATLDDPAYVVFRYALHMSSSSGFTPSQFNFKLLSQTNRFTYVPLESEVNTTQSFVVRALTDRGSIDAVEVSKYVSFIASTDLQDTALQQAGKVNLVWDGDFDTSGDGDTGWTGGTGTFREFPASNSGDYDDPLLAADDDTSDFSDFDAFSTATDGTHSWTFGAFGLQTGRLTVEHQVSPASNASQNIHYTTNSGSTWNLLAASSGTKSVHTVDLTDTDLGSLAVRGHTQWISSAGSGLIFQIYFDADEAAAVSNSEMILRNATVWRRFPVKITTSRTHLPPGSKVSLVVHAKNESAGKQPDANIDVKISNESATWTQTLHTITSTDITDSHNEFGIAGVTVTDSVTSDQWRVSITNNSKIGVALDKLSIVKGEQVPIFEPHPLEHDGGAGTIGDYGTGATSGGGNFPLQPRFTALKETP